MSVKTYISEKTGESITAFGYVKENWVKVSAIIVPALIIAFLLGRCSPI